MTIETKFDIGQEVYSIIDQKLVKGAIEEIYVKNSIACFSNTYKVKFIYEGGEVSNTLPEQLLFSTRDDVFNYLSDELDKYIEIFNEQEANRAKRLAGNPDDRWKGVKSWTS